MIDLRGFIFSYITWWLCQRSVKQLTQSSRPSSKFLKNESCKNSAQYKSIAATKRIVCFHFEDRIVVAMTSAMRSDQALVNRGCCSPPVSQPPDLYRGSRCALKLLSMLSNRTCTCDTCEKVHTHHKHINAHRCHAKLTNETPPATERGRKNNTKVFVCCENRNTNRGTN